MINKEKVKVNGDGSISKLKSKSDDSKKRKKNDSDDGDEEEKINKQSKIMSDESNKVKFPKDLWKNGEQAWRDNSIDSEYLRTNPEGITRIFCGNLNKNIKEEELKGCLEGITYIKWITDKQTKEFYGSTFLELKDSKCAAEAVMKDRQKFMGRPLKIYYCPPRPGT